MSRVKWILGAIAGLVFLSGMALWPAFQRASLRPKGNSEREVQFRYRVTIPSVPSSARRVFVWAPMPFTDTYQTLNGFDVRGPATYTIAEESEYGNRFLVFDLSPAVTSTRDSITLEIDYRGSRRGYRVVSGTPAGSAVPPPPLRLTIDSGWNMDKFLRPSGLIPIDGRIAAEAKSVAGRIDDPLMQARTLYDHIVGTVLYDKSGQGWGNGDAVYACDFRKGNCTDFHSLFIGEARSLGIPARFVMGFPLPANRRSGAIAGYHCWAEFFVEPYGWVPIDASEAQKNRSRQDELFGGLDPNRIGFTIGRDIRLPGAAAGPLNYVIYPHVEIDGQVYSNVRAEFEFSDAS